MRVPAVIVALATAQITTKKLERRFLYGPPLGVLDKLVIMPEASPARESDVLRRLWWGALVSLAVSAAVFTLFPELDLATSALFYSKDAGFVGIRLAWLDVVRQGFTWLLYGFILLAITGVCVALRARRPRTTVRQWLFFAACLAAGPGLVANTLFKDQWGRARPRQVVEFSGDKIFTPALLPSRQCHRNCSFVSGEASSMFLPFYAASLVLPQWSAVLVAVGTVAGAAAGLMRIAQGGHFLSDVVFAGVFMALTALLVHGLMFRRSKSFKSAPIKAEA